MNIISSTVPLVVLDDAGVFRRYRDVGALVGSGQRPESTRCVVDRDGQYFHLETDPAGNLRLSRPFGPIEFHSLRGQFVRDQHRHPELHRILRVYPDTMGAFLDSLFEELALEEPGDEQQWLVIAGGQTLRAPGLDAVDRRVVRAPEASVVVDPFGHRYRPRMVRRGGLARRLRGRPVYVEIAG
ncbi:hypothetical protein [Sinomonas sp. P47F7]|uniref:hypothetical protein n=1 Tax=Sinomonas sp. P47F7 TaxID=3410987 RepID=UPI003BF593D7